MYGKKRGWLATHLRGEALHIATAYAAAAFVLVEVTATIFDSLDLPVAIMALVVTGVLAGLPIALVVGLMGSFGAKRRKHRIEQHVWSRDGRTFVSVRVTDARTGRVVWARTYERVDGAAQHEDSAIARDLAAVLISELR